MIEDTSIKVAKVIERQLQIDIFSTRRSRKQEYVEARVIYFKIMTDEGFIQTEIADTLNMHRSIIVHALKSFNDWYDIDKWFRNKYDRVAGELHELSSIQKNSIKAHLENWYLPKQKLYINQH